MGNAIPSSNGIIKRKRPNIIDEDDIKSGNIPFVKNVNRYGDSDYDDEIDDEIDFMLVETIIGNRGLKI